MGNCCCGTSGPCDHKEETEKLLTPATQSPQVSAQVEKTEDGTAGLHGPEADEGSGKKHTDADCLVVTAEGTWSEIVSAELVAGNGEQLETLAGPTTSKEELENQFETHAARVPKHMPEDGIPPSKPTVLIGPLNGAVGADLTEAVSPDNVLIVSAKLNQEGTAENVRTSEEKKEMPQDTVSKEEVVADAENDTLPKDLKAEEPLEDISHNSVDHARGNQEEEYTSSETMKNHETSPNHSNKAEEQVLVDAGEKHEEQVKEQSLDIDNEPRKALTPKPEEEHEEDQRSPEAQDSLRPASDQDQGIPNGDEGLLEKSEEDARPPQDDSEAVQKPPEDELSDGNSEPVALPSTTDISHTVEQIVDPVHRLKLSDDEPCQLENIEADTGAEEANSETLTSDRASPHVSDEDLYRSEDEIEHELGKLPVEMRIAEEEDRCSIGPPVDIKEYSKREWRGQTAKSTLIRKGYTELSQRFGSVRRVRGDNYCALRATLFQGLSNCTEVPARLQEDGLLSWQESAGSTGPEERLRICEQVFQGGEEEFGLLEALKLLMLSQAAKLHACMQRGEDVPVFCWLLFARDTSEFPRTFLNNHLSHVGFSGGLEQVEMFLLGYAMQHTLQVYRLYKAGTEEFITYYPDDHKDDWPCLCLVTEDDRHYNLAVGEPVPDPNEE
ncbi:uncharacterized protein LOC114784771 isoform X2 [Denticeps clupeoides]|uniref:uncharacterized protein LOC114784771 isoform X2 n=1 Tax=Denticeps clupeoides TaxID=299321 RepID=UPI0010A47E1F|nr:uncharacterized protein LOC114784771 isoform X2 [Denticeps clupeoides]